MERCGRADRAALPLHGAERAEQLDAGRGNQRTARQVVPARAAAGRGRERTRAAAAAVGARRASGERCRHPGVPGRQRQPAAAALHARLAEERAVHGHRDRAAARVGGPGFDDRFLALRALRAIAEPRVLREQRLPVYALRGPVADGGRDRRPAVAAGAGSVPDDARPHGRVDGPARAARAARAAGRGRRGVGQGSARDRRRAVVPVARALACVGAARDQRAWRARRRAAHVLGKGALAQWRRPLGGRRADRAERRARGAARLRAARQPRSQRRRVDGDRPAAPRRSARRVRAGRAHLAGAGRSRAGAAGRGRQHARRGPVYRRLRAMVCARLDRCRTASARARRGRRRGRDPDRARRVQPAAAHRRAPPGGMTDGVGNDIAARRTARGRRDRVGGAGGGRSAGRRRRTGDGRDRVLRGRMAALGDLQA
ncbi:protein of unknown function [Burkholderia multivorans]